MQNNHHLKEAKATGVKPWEELFKSWKLGYRKLLSCLRSILEGKPSEDLLERISVFLSNPMRVKRSKLTPFCYLGVFYEIWPGAPAFSRTIYDALDEAARLSLKNLRWLENKTWIFVATNLSDSMLRPVCADSQMRYMDIGILLSYLLKAEHGRTIAGVFGAVWEEVPFYGAPLENTVNMHHFKDLAGQGNNGHLAIDCLLNDNIRMDKVMLFTDSDLWLAESKTKDSWHRYKALFPEAELFLFNLAGGGNGRIDQAEIDVFLVSGWNDSVIMEID